MLKLIMISMLTIFVSCNGSDDKKDSPQESTNPKTGTTQNNRGISSSSYDCYQINEDMQDIGYVMQEAAETLQANPTKLNAEILVETVRTGIEDLEVIIEENPGFYCPDYTLGNGETLSEESLQEIIDIMNEELETMEEALEDVPALRAIEMRSFQFAI